MADFAVVPSAGTVRAVTYLDRQRRRRDALVPIGIFVAGALSAIQVANFTVTALSLVCLALAPAYLLIAHRGVELVPVALAALAWVSYLASCIANGVGVLSPNAIAPAAFGVYLMGIAVMTGRSVSAIGTALAGISVGTIGFHVLFGIELTRTGQFADLWKYGIAPAVTVLALFALIKFGARPLALALTLGGLGCASLALNYRSHAMICLVAAAIIGTGWLLAPRIGRAKQFAVVAGFAIIAAVALPLIARAGIFGAALQTKVQETDANGIPPLFASRTEPPLSLTAIWERPLLGWGSPEALTNQLLIRAEHFAIDLGYSPTIPFEAYWHVPGDYSALHSLLLGSWAEGGLLALLLPLWLLVACAALVWNYQRYGRWAPMVVVLGVQGIWDLLYSPWSYNLIPIYACIALLFLARHFRLPQGGEVRRAARLPARLVSVVVPTIGRETVDNAVRSALGQTFPPVEVIVVADTDETFELPSSDLVRIIRVGPGAGPARARQAGIDAAHGDLVALLDDDDQWHPDKLRRQLLAVAERPDDNWVVSSRITVAGPGDRRRIWPRRLIRPTQPVAEYLYRFSDLTVGGAALQTSTLLFPTSLAADIRWDTDPEGVHDEASWLIRLQRATPTIEVIQLPDTLSTYRVGATSRSRSTDDRSVEYTAWGLDYLAHEPARVRGDYLCTSPVSAAVAAGSVRGVRRATITAVRRGRPGPYALAYAALNGIRVVVLRLRPAQR